MKVEARSVRGSDVVIEASSVDEGSGEGERRRLGGMVMLLGGC